MRLNATGTRGRVFGLSLVAALVLGFLSPWFGGGSGSGVNSADMNNERSDAHGVDGVHGPALPAPTTPSRPAGGGSAPCAVGVADGLVDAAINQVVPNTAVAFAVFDRQQDRMLVETGTRPLYAASVVKLLIALDVLRANDWRLPDAGSQGDLNRMLGPSDDGVASRLWESRGQTDIINRMVGEIGLQRTTAPRQAGEWELTTMSAGDVITTYRFILDRLLPTERDFLLTSMRDAPRRAADGFDQYFGIPNGLSQPLLAIKQGWMYTARALVLNTTGIVGEGGRYITALLTEQPPGTSMETGKQAVTAGIATLDSALTQPTEP